MHFLSKFLFFLTAFSVSTSAFAELEQSRDFGTVFSKFSFEKRDTPPTKADFDVFFKSIHGKSDKVLFWSGTTPLGAEEFGAEHDRFSIEMLLGEKWLKYQQLQLEGGHWATWDDRQKNFWIPISESLAEWATGDAWLYVTTESQEDQTNPKCTTCWYEVEKPILIRRLGHGVTSIKMYKATANANTLDFVKNVVSLTDKRGAMAWQA